MIRVVIDTNVVVSALIASTGNEALLLLAITQNLLRPCYSDGIFEEYAEVLRRPKFGFSSNEVQAVLRLLREHGSLVNPSSWPRVSVDPEDDKFIACASAAKAHFLVTGNRKHFPQTELGDTRVVNASELIALVSVDL